MKTSFRTFVAAGLLAASVGVSASANAQTTVHTTLAAFLAATQGPTYTETFSSTTGSGNPSVSYASLGYGYTVSAPGGIYLSGAFIGNNLPTESLTFTFTTGNVTAIGGNWFATNISDVFQASPITLLLSNGTSTTFTPTSAVGSFRGFTTTGVAITSLTVSTAAAFYNSVDNVVVGRAMPMTNVVPEPSTYVLMATGMLGLMGVARRRSRVS